MTDQPDPSVKSGATAAVAAASPPPPPAPVVLVEPPVDTSHAAPGPLFLDQHDNLESEPQELEERPAPPPERTAEPLSMTKAPMTERPVTGATPLTGGRAPVIEVPVRPFVPLQERPAPHLGAGPAAVFPVPPGPTRAALGTDVVTCPECGQLATVDMARRQADDFCRRCDFPLFWARGTVISPEGEESGASLRRLPGTVGRAATAALICPHCSEPNSPAAEICVRCALSLHPVDIPEPEPVVVFAPVPEPEPEPEPQPGFDWWWIVALAAALVGIALVIGLLYLR